MVRVFCFSVSHYSNLVIPLLPVDRQLAIDSSLLQPIWMQVLVDVRPQGKSLGVHASIFLVNLRYLKKYIINKHFRMKTILLLIPLLSQGYIMVSYRPKRFLCTHRSSPSEVPEDCSLLS